ncbi:MAG: peptide ABC transporter substrate-binding protein [Bryobacteraceae bacterium]
MNRRAVIAAAPLALAGCGQAGATYFGRTEPPRSQRLVYLLDADVTTLDPVLSASYAEAYIIHALFEGLTSLDPATGAPRAALATHFEMMPDRLRYTFYLRGHRSPRGTALSPVPSLPAAAARWSDGSVITAHDFVRSWRRAADPDTAAELAFLLNCVRNAQGIVARKLAPENLGVRAIDEFTLQADLEFPAPYFLELASHRVLCPSSSRPTAASGAFTLKERRFNDRIVLSRNPKYYDAGQVALDELAFLVVPDPTARANMYKAGDADVMAAYLPAILPALSRTKDLHTFRSYTSFFAVMNTKAPPFDDVRVRYAFNMATEKKPLTDLLNGLTPAASLAPSVAGYETPRSLPVTIDGTVYDVLSFNPRAARALLAKAVGDRPLRTEYLLPARAPAERLMAEVLQQQWRNTLGIDLTLSIRDVAVWAEDVRNGNYTGVADWGVAGGYVDPAFFLDQFAIGNGANPSGWSDPHYDAMLREARTATDPAERMKKLAGCERRLLGAMPFIPLFTDAWIYLWKPYVRGLGSNPLDRQQFKYASIDTTWRPS